jgi:hypothetical protein
MLDKDLIHVYDTATGVLTGLGLSGWVSLTSADLITFTVWESAHGDLNGDGETYDHVLHVYDVASGVTTNLGVVVQWISHVDGEMFAFTVDENRQGYGWGNGVDLNGDGDGIDKVLHVHDAATGATTNLELAEDGYPRLSGRRVAFRVSEADQGNTDLNGDGDTSDTVLHVADFSVQTVEIDIKPNNDDNVLNLASNGMIAVAILSTEDFDAGQVDASTVVFAGASAVHSAMEDVDGDGDLDMVLHFRVQETNLADLYAQLLAEDINQDGALDSNGQSAAVSLTGETVGDECFEGFDDVDLFLSGKNLRDLLEDLAEAGAI